MKEANFCCAYLVQDLASHPLWEASVKRELGPEAVVYLHEDFVVTQGLRAGEDIVFDNVDEAWRIFCEKKLKFQTIA